MSKFHGDHQIWSYCIYLGPYTAEGDEVDLGVYIDKQGNISLAAVYGPEDHQYQSGGIIQGGRPTGFIGLPIYSEAYRRYRSTTTSVANP